MRQGFLTPLVLTPSNSQLNIQSMKAVIEKSKYPIVLRDYLSIGKRKARVKIEIHEDKVISFLDGEEDFFAEGRTVKEAKDNLITVMLDEKEFFERHKEELGKPLITKYQKLLELFG